MSFDLENSDGVRDFLSGLASDLLERLPSVADCGDDETRLERATAIVAVREYGESIEASGTLLRKLLPNVPEEIDA